MKSRVLVVSPHFDDEVIGCGGVVQHHQTEGAQVAILYVSRGDCGDIRQGMNQHSSAETRQAEALRVSAFMGVEAHFLNVENEGFLRPDPATEQAILRFVREYRPTVVYCPHPEEAHSDHQVVAALTRGACIKASMGVFPHLGTPKHNLEELRFYEVWTPMRQYNIVVNTSPYIERKIEAISLYASQTAAVNYAEAARGLNRYRGLMTAGFDYAEVFFAERLRPWKLGG